jgi:asparagine synthase (glutamine-hydrolysing)
MYDEPFADSSQIPTHLVCRAARQHVTVALSGDAGDELFGGYNRYSWGPRIWGRVAWLPHPLRRALAGAIAAVPVGGWDALGRAANAVLPATRGVALLGEKAQKLATTLQGARSLDGVYLRLVSEWHDPERVVRGEHGRASAPLDAGGDALPRLGIDEAPLRMMFRDAVGYLPDDILCKVDRAAMAVSLETRVPFLDHRVAALAWRLPLSLKIRAGEGKWALRKLLYRHVPRELIERPKAGFAIPVGRWLRGPLRPWAESLLDPRRLSDGFLDPRPVRALWEEHLAGGHDWTSRLWTVLMFQAWQGARC